MTEQLTASLVAAPFLGCAVLAAELARPAGAVDILTAIGSVDRKVTMSLSRDLNGLATSAGEPAGAVALDAAGCDEALAELGRDLALLEIQNPTSPCIDLTRGMVEAIFAAAGTVVGQLDQAMIERSTALALTALTADLVGTMQGWLSLAFRYASQREQFGPPIGPFQAIARVCAEQAVRVTRARSAMHYAARCADESPAEALDAARIAKAYAAKVR